MNDYKAIMMNNVVCCGIRLNCDDFAQNMLKRAENRAVNVQVYEKNIAIEELTFIRNGYKIK